MGLRDVVFRAAGTFFTRAGDVLRAAGPPTVVVGTTVVGAPAGMVGALSTSAGRTPGRGATMVPGGLRIMLPAIVGSRDDRESPRRDSPLDDRMGLRTATPRTMLCSPTAEMGAGGARVELECSAEAGANIESHTTIVTTAAVWRTGVLERRRAAAMTPTITPVVLVERAPPAIVTSRVMGGGAGGFLLPRVIATEDRALHCRAIQGMRRGIHLLTVNPAECFPTRK